MKKPRREEVMEAWERAALPLSEYGAWYWRRYGQLDPGQKRIRGAQDRSVLASGNGHLERRSEDDLRRRVAQAEPEDVVLLTSRIQEPFFGGEVVAIEGSHYPLLLRYLEERARVSIVEVREEEGDYEKALAEEVMRLLVRRTRGG